jgi:protoporphyrin/coproporphyrin ferrochelatase
MFMPTANPKPQSPTGVIIMTYGSATTAEHVAEYMQNIYGPQASAATIADFEERYRLVGRSPLIDITLAQAEALQTLLGDRFVVRAGMQHSEPTIAGAVAEIKAAGARKLIGIVLSPQFSSLIMDGYRAKLAAAAAAQHGFKSSEVIVAPPWPAEPHFVKLLANRVTTSLADLKKQFGVAPPLIFTTHSLPERVVAKDPSYLEQLAATTEAVLARLPRPISQHFSAYQSAGHTPESWLKPDLVDILADLRDQHHRAVLIVPIQFLADHLEILYDLDIAAGAQCRDYGIAYHRIELPGTDPLFIQSLAAVARKTI